MLDYSVKVVGIGWVYPKSTRIAAKPGELALGITANPDNKEQCTGSLSRENFPLFSANLHIKIFDIFNTYY